MSDTWEYSDEIALLAKRLAALEQRVTDLIAAFDLLKDGVARAAEYQGVKHLLAPQ